jgi:hypothetical protein
MKNIIASICLFGFRFASRNASLAWSSPGHMTIAVIAYLLGNLAGSTNRDNALALPDGYTKNMKQICREAGGIGVIQIGR